MAKGPPQPGGPLKYIRPGAMLRAFFMVGSVPQHGAGVHAVVRVQQIAQRAHQI